MVTCTFVDNVRRDIAEANLLINIFAAFNLVGTSIKL